MDLNALKGKTFLRKYLPWFAAALGLIAVAGFLAVPPILKSVLVRQLSDKLHRETSIRQIEFNPFNLAVKVTGFSMKDRGGAGPFLSFEELYLNFEIASVFRGGPVVRDILLKSPSVTVIRKEDLSYNFSDLLEEFASKPAAGSKPLRYSLNNIQIVDGSVDFDDRPKRTRHAVRDLRVAIPFFSNFPYYVDAYVQPVFLAKVNGTPVDLRGKTKPFSDSRETSFDVNFRDFNIPYYLEYLPVKLKIKVVSALLDAAADLSFREYKDKPPVLSLTGTVALKDLNIADGKGTSVLRLPLLDVSIASFDVFGRKASLASVLFRSPDLQLARDREGVLNVVSLLDPREGAAIGGAEKKKAEETGKEKETGAPILLEIAEIRLTGGKVGFTDELPRKPFHAALDSIDFSFRCRYAKGEGSDEMTVSGLSADLGPLKVRSKGESWDFLKIPAVSVKGTDIDLGKRTLTVGEVSTRGGGIRMIREGDGSVNLESLAPPPAPSERGKAAAPAPAKSGSPPEWLVTIAKAVVERYSVKVEDRTTSPPVVLSAEPIVFSADNLSTRKGAAGKASLRVALNREGTLAAAGTVGLNPFSANLHVDARGIGIIPFQPYFTEKVRIVVTGGSVSAKGTLALGTASDKALTAAYKGEVSLTDLATVDKAAAEDFLKWKSLHLGGIDAQIRPLRVEIDEIALADFYSRLAVNPDGTLNVQRIFVGEPKAAAPNAGTAPPPTTARGGAAPGDGTPTPPSTTQGAAALNAGTAPPPTTTQGGEPARVVRIEKVTVQGGTVHFSDRYVKPNYVARLAEMGGRISGLSSEESKFADVDLRGKLENYAPLEITGKINPLRNDLYVDLKAEFKDIELSPLTPYSGKYAGYAIEKGKLTLALKYLITRRTLDASNHVFLDQFTFGNPVESPDATKLPVRLAVALLKDRRGEINLDIPVSGSLDDPKFSVGGVVIKIIVNLLVKAATSPFALLGAIFGGGEEMSTLEFDYGKADLNASMEARVNTLEKVLHDRPGLKLEIAGRVDAAKDRDGLLRSVFERKLKAQKLSDLAKRGTPPASLDNVAVAPEEYPIYLKMAYKKEKFPKPRNIIGMAKDLPAPEMEKLMLTNIKITDDDLRQLAMRRAQGVRDALLKPGRVPPERVFLVEPKTLSPEKKEKLKDSRVDFVLK
ncbi:MAG: DUF748 domain-containing protein [Deltaproteobacteria bacterium]|nr:DUF748 domain-containing protein [Deltaproteobacteria bacterium]